MGRADMERMLVWCILPVNIPMQLEHCVQAQAQLHTGCMLRRPDRVPAVIRPLVHALPQRGAAPGERAGLPGLGQKRVFISKALSDSHIKQLLGFVLQRGAAPGERAGLPGLPPHPHTCAGMVT